MRRSSFSTSTSIRQTTTAPHLLFPSQVSIPHLVSQLVSPSLHLLQLIAHVRVFSHGSGGGWRGAWVRLVAPFTGVGLMFVELDILHLSLWWVVLLALFVCVGATNIINFMDGINGITGGYALASLVPLYLLNRELGFVEESLIISVVVADGVFCLFNFRPKGKAKCFAGDVGSIGVAFILLFLIGRLVMQTGDVTYLIFLLVYGVDGCLTICHRIRLHENLGEAHRKHAFQLMANELRIGHVKIALFYTLLQLAISLSFVYLCPKGQMAHWVFLMAALALLSAAYILFMRKYYHLHEEYLASLRK